MNNSTQRFWVSLEPYVYAEIKNDTALLYNSFSKTSHVFKDEEMLQLISKIKNSDQGGCVLTHQEMLFFHQSVSFLCEKCLGISFRLSRPEKSLPFQFKDEIYFEKDFIGFSSEDSFSLYHTASLFNELMQVNIFLTTHCTFNCRICDIACKQSLYCFSEKKTRHLSIESFKYLVSIICNTNCSVNLLGGDITKHLELGQILTIIESFPNICFWLHYNSRQFRDIEKILDYIPGNIRLVSLCNNPNEYNMMIQSISKQMADKIYKHKVLLFSEEEINVIDNKEMRNVVFIPIYDGNNFDFFKKSVFSAEEDFTHCDLTINQILINKRINSINYGVINVFPDGTIKTNINNKPLGNLSEGLENLLWREMKRKDGWMKTRTEKPCNDCIYQYLCPPPSNYEVAIGKPNLCTVKP